MFSLDQTKKKFYETHKKSQDNLSILFINGNSFPWVCLNISKLSFLKDRVVLSTSGYPTYFFLHNKEILVLVCSDLDFFLVEMNFSLRSFFFFVSFLHNTT